MRRQRQRGDTIVEVLFAITIFSLVAVGGLSIMNQGTLISQRALEVTLVRQQMDAQAEALRYLNTAHVASFGQGTAPTARSAAGQWAVATSDARVRPQPSPFGITCTPPERSFIVNTATARVVTSGFVPASTFSQIRYDEATPTTINSIDGLWIEAVRGAGDPSVAQFIDFHIRACWDSPGQAAPMTLGTIVRLYEPQA